MQVEVMEVIEVGVNYALSGYFIIARVYQMGLAIQDLNIIHQHAWSKHLLG